MQGGAAPLQALPGGQPPGPQWLVNNLPPPFQRLDRPLGRHSMTHPWLFHKIWGGWVRELAFGNDFRSPSSGMESDKGGLGKVVR